MANVTLSTLRTRARARADQANSTFVSDTDLNAFINYGIAELHDLLVTAFEDYYVKSSTITTTANEDEYSLPSDFYKLRGVDLEGSAASDTVSLERFEWSERDLYREDPPSGKTIRVWYVHAAPELVNDGDVFDGISAYDDFVVAEAARRMRQKEESDTTDLLQDKMLVQQRIERAAARRDAEQPPRAPVRRRMRRRMWHPAAEGLWGGAGLVYCLRGTKLVVRAASRWA